MNPGQGSYEPPAQGSYEPASGFITQGSYEPCFGVHCWWGFGSAGVAREVVDGGKGAGAMGGRGWGLLECYDWNLKCPCPTSA